MYHVTHKQISEAYADMSAAIKRTKRNIKLEAELQLMEWRLGKLEQAKRLSLPKDQDLADQLFMEALGGGILKVSD